MPKIILDTSVIIRYPAILSTKVPDVTFIVPTHVQREVVLRTRNIGITNAFISPYQLFLRQAIENKTIESASSPVDSFPEWDFLFKHITLEGADDQIIQIADDLKNKGQDVKIATFDKEINQYALNNKIKIASRDEIESYLSGGNNSVNQEELKERIINNEDQQFKNFIIALLIALVIFYALYELFPVLIYVMKLNALLALALSIVVAGGLYAFKIKYLGLYAMVEYLVGIVTIFLILKPIYDQGIISFKDFSVSMKIAAGLYVMVRGTDNFDKSIGFDRVRVFCRKIITKLGISRNLSMLNL